MHVWPARLHFRRVAAACVTVCLLPVRYVWGCFISVRQGGGCTSLTPPCAIMSTMPTTKLDRSSSSASCSLQGPWRQMEVAAYSMFQQAYPVCKSVLLHVQMCIAPSVPSVLCVWPCVRSARPAWNWRAHGKCHCGSCSQSATAAHAAIQLGS